LINSIKGEKFQHFFKKNKKRCTVESTELGRKLGRWEDKKLGKTWGGALICYFVGKKEEMRSDRG
jgi:hypothetical protein